MSYLFQEFQLPRANWRACEHDSTDRRAINFAICSKHRFSPALPQGGFDIRLSKHFVTGSIGVKHDRAQVHKLLCDKALAAGNSAEQTDDRRMPPFVVRFFLQRIDVL